MKKLVGKDFDFGGGDVKATAGAQLGVEGSDLMADIHIQARVPVEKVAAPAFKVIDDLVDKIEQIIPGDQKAIAAGLKADARQMLIKALASQAKDVTPADPEPQAVEEPKA